MKTIHSASILRFLIFIGSTLLLQKTDGSKYNQRVFENVAAINFAESERNGFRVILSDGFISRHLRPGSLPTIFVTAIPLHPDKGQERFTHVFYPEKRIDDKLLVRVHNLRARSWYYVCIEWENINRHNDTTGTSCKLYRTLDKFGKTAATTITDVQVSEMTESLARFRIRYDADFPVRLTAYLKGGHTKIAAQTFLLSQPAWADVVFPFLQSSTNYGQLCVMEEPLVNAYSAMGRLISGQTDLPRRRLILRTEQGTANFIVTDTTFLGLTHEKCYFDGLKTKSIRSLMESVEEEPKSSAAAFKQQQQQQRGNQMERNRATTSSFRPTQTDLSIIIIPFLLLLLSSTFTSIILSSNPSSS